MEDVAAEGGEAALVEAAEEFHGGHEEAAAGFDVVAERLDILGAEHGDELGDAPDDDGIVAEFLELRGTHFDPDVPDVVVDAEVVEGTGVAGERDPVGEDDVAAELVDEEDRGGGLDDDLEGVTGVVAGRFVAGEVTGADPVEHGLLGGEAVEGQLVGGVEGAVGDRGAEAGGGPELDDGIGVLVGFPGDHEAAEAGGGGDRGDDRGRSRRRRWRTGHREGGIGVPGADGVAVDDLEAAVGEGGAGGRRDRAGEHAGVAEGAEREVLAVGFGVAGELDVDAGGAAEVEVDEAKSDRGGDGVGEAVEDEDPLPRERDGGGGEEGEVLDGIGAGTPADVLDHAGGADADEVFAGTGWRRWTASTLLRKSAARALAMDSPASKALPR